MFSVYWQGSNIIQIMLVVLHFLPHWFCQHSSDVIGLAHYIWVLKLWTIYRGEIGLYSSCTLFYIYIVIYTDFDFPFLSEIVLNLIYIPLSTVDKLNRANAQKWLMPAQWLVVQWLVANAVAEWLSVQWLDAISSK